LTRIADGRGYAERACGKVPAATAGIVTHPTDNDRAEGETAGCAVANIVTDAAADEAENGLG